MDFGKFEFSEIEKQKICELRNLVKNCQQLKIGTEDVLLTKYLYSTDWNVEDAFNSIDKYYTFKQKNPKWMSNRPLSELMEVFSVIKPRFLLTKPDREGRVIMVFQVVDAFDKYPNFFFDLVEFDDLIIEAILSTPRGQKYGLCILYDFSSITMNIIKIMTPSKMKLINKKNDVVPCTNRFGHIIQKGFLMNAASILIMPFISKSMKDKILIHDTKDLDKLRSTVGYENLPAIYGGPPENTLNGNNLVYELIDEHWDYLKKCQTYVKIK